VFEPFSAIKKDKINFKFRRPVFAVYAQTVHISKICNKIKVAWLEILSILVYSQ
jgi:hypothetical protein